MKFQNLSIHHSKVSNFTEKWKNQSKLKNSVFLSKFDGKFSKVDAPSSVRRSQFQRSSPLKPLGQSKLGQDKNTGQLFFHKEYTHEISYPYHAPFKN